MKYLYGTDYRDILDAWRPDNYTIYGYGGADDIYGSDYADNIYAGAGDDLVYGYGGADLINGNGGWDWISGGAGNDTINGGGGYDKLHGNQGADLIRGGDNWDDIYGGDGNDVLEGNQGDDYLVGGANRDTFVFRSGDDGDVIADFRFGQDKIEFDLGNIDTFRELRGYMYRDGPDTFIDLPNGDFVIVANTAPGQFIASDFIFT